MEASMLWWIPCCGHSAHGWLPRHHQFPFFHPSNSTHFCSGRPLFSLLWSSPAVLVQLNPPPASQVVQWQRVHLPRQEMQETLVPTLLGWEDPLEKETATHSSILALGSSMNRVWQATVHGVTKELDTPEWARTCTHTYLRCRNGLLLIINATAELHYSILKLFLKSRALIYHIAFQWISCMRPAVYSLRFQLPGVSTT